MLLKRLGAAMGGPYYAVNERVRAVARAQEEYVKTQREKGTLSGALCGMVLPVLWNVHVRAARTEAHTAGLWLLAAACVEHAETGRYPSALKSLGKYFPEGLPKDPFTGKDFAYRLEEGLPTAECRGDAPEEKRRRPEIYVFSLSAVRRRERDKACVETT